MAEKQLNLYQKLLEIQKSILGLSKNEKSFQYKYVTGNKIMGFIKPLMNEQGLLLKQELVKTDYERMDYEAKGKSKSEVLYLCDFKFTWIDTTTGEKDENLFAAAGMNDWEKGMGSAMTYAERYFLLKFFHISTDQDDIDNPNRKQQSIEAEPNPKVLKKASKAVEKKVVTMNKVEMIDAITKALDTDVKLKKVLNHYNVPAIREMEESKLQECCKMLKIV